MSWTIKGNGTGQDLLYSQAGTPSLDLRFASTKSLNDYVSGNNLITFTRASSGTYVDSTGVLRTATTNLLLRSEEFNSGDWTRVGSTVSANSIASPTGAITADTLVEDTSTGTHRCVTSAAIANTSIHTVSVYAKAAGRTHIRLSAGSGLAGEIIANLSNGTVASSSGATNPTVQSVGDGWYRVSFTTAASSSTTGQVQVQLVQGTSTVSYTGDGTSGLYVWGAQLEQSSSVGEYIPTTSSINSAARYDHDPVSLISKGLLLEDARTNLAVQSENFGTTWTTLGLLAFGSGSTLDAIAAPNGQITADLLTEDSANSEHRVGGAAIPWIGNTSYTFTVYVKSAGRTRFDLLFGTLGNWSGGRQVVFDLSNGTVNSTDGATGSITALPNGWYRCRITSLTVLSPSASSVFVRFLDNLNNSVYTGNGTSGIYVWGAQLEAGAFPTSYIPTTSATVTRAADVAQIAGSNFSSWYNQTEGTVFAEGNSFGFSASSFPTFATISDGTNSNKLEYGYLTSSLGGYIVRSGNANVVEIYPNITANPRRAAFAAAANNYAVSYNGASPTVDTAGAMPVSASQMQIGSGFSGGATNNFFGTIKRLTYWPTRLADTTLQTITL